MPRPPCSAIMASAFGSPMSSYTKVALLRVTVGMGVVLVGGSGGAKFRGLGFVNEIVDRGFDHSHRHRAERQYAIVKGADVEVLAQKEIGRASCRERV